MTIQAKQSGRNRSGEARNLDNSLESYELRLDKSWEYAMSEGSLFFEGQGSVQKCLRKITRRLEELSIPYSVVGGMALVHHGYRRFTEDVDILVTREGLKKIHEELDGRGFVRPFEKCKNLRETETGVKIEFLLTGDYPGDGKPKAISFPDPRTVSETGAEGIKFLNLPTLITLKLASGLSGSDRGKDLADVEELIKLLDLSDEFAAKLDSSVRAGYLAIWSRVSSVPKRYQTIWRNKWLTADAKSLDEMIAMLQGAAAELEAMRIDGVTLDPGRGTGDDYAFLITTNAAIAKKYGMEPEDEFFDEDDEEDNEDRGSESAQEQAPDSNPFLMDCLKRN